MEAKKILIIEDDWHFRVLLETSLTETGYDVRCAENGKAGIAVVSSWHPDLVIMDLEMPVMDGIPTIYVLREKGYQGKIAVLSGNLSAENREKAGEAGANHFFSKPFQDPKGMVDQVFSQAGSTSKTSLENWAIRQPAPEALAKQHPPPKSQGTSAPKHIQNVKHRRHSNRRPMVKVGMYVVLTAIVVWIVTVNWPPGTTLISQESESALSLAAPVVDQPAMVQEKTDDRFVQGPASQVRGGGGDQVKVITNRGTVKDRKAYFHTHDIANYYCDIYLKSGCVNQMIFLNPLEKNFEHIHQGRVLYGQHCERCHGATGRGNGPDAISLSSLPPARLSFVGDDTLHKDAFLFWTIAEGGLPIGSDMPKFADILSKKQIWSIIFFVGTL